MESDKAMRVYTLADGKLVKTLSGHGAAVTAVEFSRDNAKLLSGSADGRLRAWDLKTDRVLQHFQTTGRSREPAFSNDNRTIAFAGTDKAVHIESISVQAVIAADDKEVISLGISGNSAVLVTAGPGGVKSWNARQRPADPDVCRVARWSPGGGDQLRPATRWPLPT